jgi:hypothetical protein
MKQLVEVAQRLDLEITGNRKAGYSLYSKTLPLRNTSKIIYVGRVAYVEVLNFRTAPEKQWRILDYRNSQTYFLTAHNFHLIK